MIYQHDFLQQDEKQNLDQYLEKFLKVGVYVENYIPDSKQKTYEHLDRKTVWNSSTIVDHPKGRQKWKLNTDQWEW